MVTLTDAGVYHRYANYFHMIGDRMFCTKAHQFLSQVNFTKGIGYFKRDPKQVHWQVTHFNAVLMMLLQSKFSLCSWFNHNSNSMEDWFQYNSIVGCITTKFCTCHDSAAVMSCAKFHSMHFTALCLKAEWNFHWICFVVEKLLVKWAQHNKSNHTAAVFSVDPHCCSPMSLSWKIMVEVSSFYVCMVLTQCVYIEWCFYKLLIRIIFLSLRCFLSNVLNVLYSFCRWVCCIHPFRSRYLWK